NRVCGALVTILSIPSASIFMKEHLVRPNPSTGFQGKACRISGPAHQSIPSISKGAVKPGKIEQRYSRIGILSRRQVSTTETIAATRGPLYIGTVVAIDKRSAFPRSQNEIAEFGGAASTIAP